MPNRKHNRTSVQTVTVGARGNGSIETARASQWPVAVGRMDQKYNRLQTVQMYKSGFAPYARGVRFSSLARALYYLILKFTKYEHRIIPMPADR